MPAALRIAQVAAAGGAAITIGVGAVTPAAAAGGAPVHDLNARGSITFCDAHDNAVTHGRLLDAPFVWKSVAASAAPSGYTTARGRATLAAYQPIEGLDPGEWSGRLLTGSTAYRSTVHPVAQATNGDAPLLFFTQAYPPRWQGLIEIRMLFTGSGLPVVDTYPATFIRVTGSTWKVIGATAGSCAGASGVSDEIGALPRRSVEGRQRVSLSADTSTRSVTGGSHRRSPASGNGTGSPDQGSSADLAARTGAGGFGGSAGSVTEVGLVSLLAVAVLGGLIVAWRRRA